MFSFLRKPAYWLGGFALSLPILISWLVMTVVEKKLISIPALLISWMISQFCYLLSIELLSKEKIIKE